MKTVDLYLQDIRDTIDLIPVDQIDEVIAILHNARINSKHVFIMGNGGSASTASHFVCDLAKNTRKKGWPEFRVIGMTDNMAILSAYANDEGYENVFAQQLNNLLQPGDIVIAISGSGNSANIIRAVEFANSRGAITIGFAGMTGGKLKTLAQKVIYVPNNQIDEVEDIHMMFVHVITRALKNVEELSVASIPEIVLPFEKENGFDHSDELVKNFFGNPLPVVKQVEVGPTPNQTGDELLLKISQEMASKLDLHNLLSRVLCLTVDYVGAAGGSIVVLDENYEVVDGAMTYAGKIQETPTDRLKEPLQHGLAGWVLENRKPALVMNTKKDPRWLPRKWESSLDLTRSAICVPLITQDRVIGILTLTRLQSNHFTMEDLSLLTSVTLALSYSFSSKAQMNRQSR